jgi:glycosyltransferase involved in cell wall biosynthesis
LVDFSVVIAAYNSQGTIGAAIGSCLDQSVTPREIIIVDDGSSDDTAEEIRQIRRCAGDGSTEIRLFVLDSNHGPAFARNVGIEEALCPWIAFLDADDTWRNTKLEEVERIIDSEREVVMIAHRYSSEKGARRLHSRASGAWRVSFWRLLLGNFMQTSCVVIKNDERYKFNKEMKYSEDFELWLRIAAAGPVRFLDLELTDLSRPQLTPGGLSSRRSHMRLGEMRAYLGAARIKIGLIFLIPALLGYSCLRHLYSNARYVLGIAN